MKDNKNNYKLSMEHIKSNKIYKKFKNRKTTTESRRNLKKWINV